jgi:hypothetical protein
MFLAFLFISACSENGVEHFSSKEEALDNLIEKEDIKGNIDLILTTRGEKLLVIQSRDDIFFVGELIKDKKGYYAQRISDSVVIGIGAAWELNTVNENKYTINFERNKDDLNYVSFSNEEYVMSLLEGHTLSEDTSDFASAIKEVEVIKE